MRDAFLPKVLGVMVQYIILLVGTTIINVLNDTDAVCVDIALTLCLETVQTKTTVQMAALL